MKKNNNKCQGTWHCFSFEAKFRKSDIVFCVCFIAGHHSFTSFSRLITIFRRHWSALLSNKGFVSPFHQNSSNISVITVYLRAISPKLSKQQKIHIFTSETRHTICSQTPLQQLSGMEAPFCGTTEKWQTGTRATHQEPHIHQLWACLNVEVATFCSL